MSNGQEGLWTSPLHDLMWSVNAERDFQGVFELLRCSAALPELGSYEPVPTVHK